MACVWLAGFVYIRHGNAVEEPGPVVRVARNSYDVFFTRVSPRVWIRICRGLPCVRALSGRKPDNKEAWRGAQGNVYDGTIECTHKIKPAEQSVVKNVGLKCPDSQRW